MDKSGSEGAAVSRWRRGTSKSDAFMGKSLYYYTFLRMCDVPPSKPIAEDYVLSSDDL